MQKSFQCAVYSRAQFILKSIFLKLQTNYGKSGVMFSKRKIMAVPMTHH